MPVSGYLEVTAAVRIPLAELEWSFVRSGGPGGQNVNKVASRAVLRWDLKRTQALPVDVRERFCQQQRNRVSGAGELIIASDRYRDQPRNIEDCLQKLQAMLRKAVQRPKARKHTRPTRASRQRRLRAKTHRATTKQSRRPPREE